MAALPCVVGRRRDPGTTRNLLLEQGGGNKESEATVAKGLQFLSNHQDRDGHWSMHEFDRHARKQVKNANGEISFVYKQDKSDPPVAEPCQLVIDYFQIQTHE